MIEGKNGKYEIVVGIEIHAQVSSRTKLFSRSKADFGSAQNENAGLYDIASPGYLPIMNKFIIEQAIKTGVGLNARVNHESFFDRKHYFYPDLPSGYQITQFYRPIIEDGFVEVDLENGTTKKIRIARAHLEQDAGKSLHDVHGSFSCIDLNRAGIPLLEIVSEPDISGSYEACEYIKNLRAILRAIGTCTGDMDKGSMRCDINVSVRKPGKPLGTRCEIKNVNSIKFVAKAIEYEAQRQVEEIEAGLILKPETRLFDATLGITKRMRDKESSSDYRYMPDPDLLSIKIMQHLIDEIKAGMPELPRAKYARYQNELGLLPNEAKVLADDVAVSSYFEEVLAKCNDAKMACNWLTTELFGRLKKLEISLEEAKVKSADLGSLISLIKNEAISGKMAKDVLDEMLNTGEDPEKIVKAKGLEQITDPDKIAKIIGEVFAKNAEKLAEYKAGKIKLFGFFAGEAMKASGGKLSPSLLNKILQEKLGQTD